MDRRRRHARQFSHAIEIARAGYTAFALIYRPDAPYCDLASAITYIIGHAAELGVAAGNYSLWGGSAGARMTAHLGNMGKHFLPTDGFCVHLCLISSLRQ